MSTSSRVARLVLTGAVVGTLLVGCGDQAGTTATEPAASTTAPAAAEAPPADLTVAELQERTLAAQREAGTGTLTMEVSGTGAEDVGMTQAEAAMDISGETPELAMTMSSSEGDMEMRLIDGSLCMRLPADAGLPADTPWLVIDPEAEDELSQQFSELAQQLQQNAMPELLTELLDAITLTAGEVEDVDGVATRRYDLVTDLSAVADTVTDPAAKAQIEAAAQAGVDTIEHSLWVDGEYLTRRVESDVPTSADKTATMVITYSGWGEPVTIEAPPADQTITVADAIAAQTGG